MGTDREHWERLIHIFLAFLAGRPLGSGSNVLPYKIVY
jgi:hypothetical protein